MNNQNLSRPVKQDLVLIRWFLQRLTALILAVCLVIHIVVVHFSFAEIISFDAVARRIKADNFWVFFYIVFLSTTLFHGLNGLYEIINDYAPSRNLRLVLAWLFWIIGILAFAWGVYVLLMFRAS